MLKSGTVPETSVLGKESNLLLKEKSSSLEKCRKSLSIFKECMELSNRTSEREVAQMPPQLLAGNIKDRIQNPTSREV